MSNFTIERNSLDYILTDVLPNELPEVFTNIYFYNYLLKHQQELDSIMKVLKEKKHKDEKIFDQIWASKPLSFNIKKIDGTDRRLSLITPLSMLNTYFFISIYRKTILNELYSPVFSIRYHTKNNKLYYHKTDSKRLVTYIYKLPQEMKKRTVEQSGSFFKIKTYNRIVDFINSPKWEELCIKYKYLLKLDYKSCFDSIYTHTYNWIKINNVNEAKLVQDTNALFPRVDQLLQNISGKITNGILVGPEFSRMMAEILLQKIDNNVHLRLNKLGYIKSVDYNIYRYVDDIFVFSNDKMIQSQIISIFNEEASNFHLSLNSLKMKQFEFPIVENPWSQQMEYLKELIRRLFNTKEQIDKNDAFLMNFNKTDIANVEKLVEKMVFDFPENKTSIIRYVLSIFVNKITERTKNVKLFSKKIDLNSSEGQSKLLYLLNLIFRIYCYDISYDSTQRLISILYSINYDVQFDKNNNSLQKIVDKYSRLFSPNLINEYINLLLIMPMYKVYFPINVENAMTEYVLNEKNPIMMACILIYSQYNSNYLAEVKNRIESIIDEKIDSLRQKSTAKSSKNFLYDEIWYVFIFAHCKFLSKNINDKIEKYLDDYCKDIVTNPNSNPSKYVPFKAANLIYDFLKNEKNLFISWSAYNFDLDKQIAYRTYYKTVFRNYSKFKHHINTSL